MDFTKIIAERAASARKAALAAKDAIASGKAGLQISSNPIAKSFCAFPDGYGRLSSLDPSMHVKKTCYSEFSRYADQVQELRRRMLSKTDGALKVLNIGVAQGQEPLTHINTAFELSQKSSKTISNFLDLRTLDIQTFAPELPYEARRLDTSVIRHLEHIYDPRSGKSIWGTPVENIVGELLQKGEKQDVILFNNIIQHMVPKNEQSLSVAFEQLADLVLPKGIICAALEKNSSVRTPEVMRRVELFRKILKDKNFVEISEGIFQKG